jgi:uncharacterized protein YjbI with pentapeptide repeats
MGGQPVSAARTERGNRPVRANYVNVGVPPVDLRNFKTMGGKGYTKTSMKMTPPRLQPQLADGALAGFLDGDLEDVFLRDVDVTNCHIVSLELSGVKLEKTTLTSAQLERISARDISMKHCDLSAAHLENGAINRAEFINCRMTGVDFSRSTLHDALFRGCKVDMANFRFADLRRVKFVDCTFAEADFLGATLHSVAFESCRLERTILDQVKCKQLDLRTSELQEISGWKSLKGAIIDDLQLVAVAPYLANELGIIVRQ